MPLGNFKLKQQGDTTTSLLEKLESKALTTLNVKIVEQREILVIAGGKAKYYSRFGR